MLGSGRFVGGPSLLGCWLGNGCLDVGDFCAVADTNFPLGTGMLRVNENP